ncbi:ribonuclease P protein component [Dongia sp.]|uniref:ribonuclease P protein component n=1 Tax=Dongia sp. TaxID=1977262 RepID=UPI0035AF9F4E
MTRIGRLKRRAEFLAAAAANRKWVAPGLVLQARVVEAGAESAPDPIRPEAIKLGFTASRKVGNAVLRNRAKRRLRAIAAEILKDVAAPSLPTDLVLIARPATVTRDYQSLKQDFTRGLQKLGVVAKEERAR